ncbi:MAG: spore germination protein GerW family protein [Oscillospiraceae bacterium]|nr:spore germination protein GerW family protein [Oscillospiraceae bacterium]MDY2848419.1 spore germination protein GerW family protein [Oscillospiraceae bacterium]
MDTRAKDLISEALGKIHEMADANTVMGDPIKVDGITIIPVSKVSYGFAGGGSDLPVKSEKEAFGGGTGGGMTLQPLGFLVVSNGDVRFIQINLDTSKTSAVVNMIPELLDKIKDMVGSKGDKSAAAVVSDAVDGEISEDKE